MIVAVFEVDVEGAAHADRFVWPDPVEELAVALGFDAELVSVVDLVAVEVLVLQRAEGALADAVLTRALAAGADVGQLRSPLDVGGEPDRLETRPVIGGDHERPDLTGRRVGQQVDERPAGRPAVLSR